VVIWSGETVDFVAVTTGRRGWSECGQPWHEIKIRGNTEENGEITQVFGGYLKPVDITTAQFSEKRGRA
jgi:hypothetical protein